MINNPATQLAALRAVRATITDSTQAAALDMVIAELVSAEVAQLRQAISGSAQVGVAIAGNMHGNIYMAEHHRHDPAQLLVNYLERVRQRSGYMLLHGLHDQQTVADGLRIGLDQVYTQLATTTLVEREVFDRSALHHHDILSFVKEHSDEQALPSKLRRAVRLRHAASVQVSDRGEAGQPAGPIQRKEEERLDLPYFSSEELATVAWQVEELTFFGPQLVTEAMAASPQLVLLGDPGSGKSTALRFLAFMLACAGLGQVSHPSALVSGLDVLANELHLLPIHLPLLPFAKRLTNQQDTPGTDDDLWNYIAQHLEAGGHLVGLAPKMFDELVTGHVILLLDGLDEVAGAPDRIRVVHAVQSFAEMYPQCRIVLTCRSRAYEGVRNQHWQLTNWPIAKLGSWTFGQMEYFVTAWYTAAAASNQLSEAWRTARIARLCDALRARADLRRLGIHPLLLTIMVLVHFNDAQLPEDRVTLYSRCLDILLGQWEIAGKDETVYGTLMQYIGLPDADVKSLRPLLARVAYAAHTAAAHGEVGRLRRADVRELVADALEQLKHPNPYDGARRFLEYTDVRAGLLQATEVGDAYAFPHQTFQEYLAGLELVSGVEFVQSIMEKRDDDRWRVPILLGIGHLVSQGALAMPYQLLNELLFTDKRTIDQEQHDLLFAAEITEDIGWARLERGGATFKRLHSDLAQALAKVVEGDVLPAADRVRAGLALNILGDLRPGVCSFPPAMVQIKRGRCVLGSSAQEARTVGQAYQRYYMERGDTTTALSAGTWPENEINEHVLVLSSFEIARYPVTNAQYARFIQEGGYEPSQPWWDRYGRIWLQRDDAKTLNLAPWQNRQFKHQPEFWELERFGKTRQNYPVVGISWYEAMAFCRWLTHHQELNPDDWIYVLPSEAEWEYTARGPARRIYPWGAAEPTEHRANFGDSLRGTSAVGCFMPGATPNDIADLGGNVWEWTRSHFQPYPYDPHDGRESAAQPAMYTFAARGGGWHSRGIRLRAATRNLNYPDNAFQDLGFRLCRRLPARPRRRARDVR